MDWSLAELKNLNYSSVSLWVLEDNILARKFYNKHCFKYDDTKKRDFPW